MAIVFDSDAGTITGLSVGGLPDGVVDAGTLAANAVTAAKLATDSVTAAKIAANSVDSAELIDGAVDDSHMASISGRKNMIINGAMQIDQRNSGVVTANTIQNYTLDRWTVYQSTTAKMTIQQKTSNDASWAATTHTNYLGMVSASAFSVGTSEQYLISQYIEGFNFSHMMWGTSAAKPMTISFWVQSSLTGTHGGALQNSSSNRCFPFSYAISSANTWERKTITIAGDTTGTWVGGSNGIGVELTFSMGTGSNYSATAGSWTSTQYVTSATNAVSVVGTSGATWNVTGIQLELGSVATDFEHRSYGEELALCQRYYHRLGGRQYESVAAGKINDANDCNVIAHFPQTMRAIPSIIIGTLSDWIQDTPSGAKSFTSISNYLGVSGGTLNTVGSSGMTSGQATTLRVNADNSYIGLDSEL